MNNYLVMLIFIISGCKNYPLQLKTLDTPYATFRILLPENLNFYQINYKGSPETELFYYTIKDSLHGIDINIGYQERYKTDLDEFVSQNLSKFIKNFRQETFEIGGLVKYYHLIYRKSFYDEQSIIYYPKGKWHRSKMFKYEVNLARIYSHGCFFIQVGVNNGMKLHELNRQISNIKISDIYFKKLFWENVDTLKFHNYYSNIKKDSTILNF